MHALFQGANFFDNIGLTLTMSYALLLISALHVFCCITDEQQLRLMLLALCYISTIRPNVVPVKHIVTPCKAADALVNAFEVLLKLFP